MDADRCETNSTASLRSHVRWTRVIQLGVNCLRALASATAFGIALGFCSSCAYEARFPSPWPQVLGWIGGLIGLAMLAGALSNRTSGQNLADSILCMTILGGGWLFAAAIGVAVPLCTWCWVFWSCIAALFAELALSQRLLSRMGLAGLAAGALVVVLAGFSPSFRWELATVLPKSVPGQIGPRIGQQLPPLAGLPSTGFVVLASNCAPCMIKGLQDRVRELEATSESVVVMANNQNKFVAALFPDTPIIRVDSGYFQKLHMRTDGPPIIVYLVNDKVKKTGPVAAFRIEEKQ